MANEITIAGALSFYKAAVMPAPQGRSFTDLLATWTGTATSQGFVSVGTSAEAIPLNDVTSVGWSFFRNCDTTNYVNLRNGASGADVLELLPGEAFPFRWKRTAVPYAIANTAACVVEFLILSL